MWYDRPRWTCHRPERPQRWPACALQCFLCSEGVVTTERAYRLQAMAAESAFSSAEDSWIAQGGMRDGASRHACLGRYPSLI